MVKMIVLKDHNEWLGSRKRIGGSDAASVVGKNPWKSNTDLFKIKTGKETQEDISNNPYVKYGTEAEEHLRELFKLDYPQMKVEYVENNMWLNDKYPFAHASLDGWLEDEDGRKGILEIKTTNISQSYQFDKWDNCVPDNYYCQILHYFMVTEFDFAIVKAQLKVLYNNNIITRHYIVQREDVEEDIEYLKEAEEIFWNNIQQGKEPDLILPDI